MNELVYAEMSLGLKKAAIFSGLWLLSVFGFLFVIERDLHTRLMGTSVIGFLIFGLLAFSELKASLALRRLLASRALTEPSRISGLTLSYVEKKKEYPVGSSLEIPTSAYRVKAMFEFQDGTLEEYVLEPKLGFKFLQRLLGDHPTLRPLVKPRS